MVPVAYGRISPRATVAGAPRASATAQASTFPGMSTPASGEPRLPDADTPAAGEEPDLARDNTALAKPRITAEESEERLPAPDE